MISFDYQHLAPRTMRLILKSKDSALMSIIEVDGQRIDSKEFLPQFTSGQEYQISVSGMKAALNLFSDDSYALTLKVVLTEDQDGNYDLNMLESRLNALKKLESNGFFLRGCDGYIVCFKEGLNTSLKDTLAEIIDACEI